jgi:hypothetical protein
MGCTSIKTASARLVPIATAVIPARRWRRTVRHVANGKLKEIALDLSRGVTHGQTRCWKNVRKGKATYAPDLPSLRLCRFRDDAFPDRPDGRQSNPEPVSRRERRAMRRITCPECGAVKPTHPEDAARGLFVRYKRGRLTQSLRLLLRPFACRFRSGGHFAAEHNA